ncbi:integrase family protein [Mesorhizobium sp. Root552]|uniref:tyrosine-type recombinase/integrase n=1 Tax=Mesorhizobium sp. Root552 TaxID=1736555 RepID=UPI001FCE0CF4
MSDEQQTGLRVRVAPTGVLTWGLVYRIKGTGSPKSVSLGKCDPHGRNGLGLSEARERAAEIIKAARQSRDLLDEERGERDALRDALTIHELIERYVKSIRSPHRKGGALRTADDIESRLLRALGAKLAGAADSLRRSDISDLLDVIAEKTPREAEKRRQVIGAMYRWGVAKGYVAMDPTAGAEVYGRGEPRDRVLSPAEIKLLWDWLDAGADSMPADCIAALKLQLCTGARIGEVSGMVASELVEDGNRLLWVLPSTRSKNKKERITPLIGNARNIAKQALSRHKNGALFRAAMSERALKATDLGHALKHRKLPCAHFTTHDLRRTAVSGMDELGISLETIAAVVGHQRGTKDTRTLVRHYSRPQLDNRIEAALKAWDTRLTEIVSNRNRAKGDSVIQFRPDFSRDIG